MSRRVFSGDALRRIGERLREVRGQQTQAEFAEAISVSRGSLSNYEAGRRLPSGSVLDRIERETGCSREWILSGVEPEMHAVRDGGNDYTSEEIENLWHAFNMLSLEHKITAARVLKMSLNEMRDGAHGKYRDELDAQIASLNFFLSTAESG